MLFLILYGKYAVLDGELGFIRVGVCRFIKECVSAFNSETFAVGGKIAVCQI